VDMDPPVGRGIYKRISDHNPFVGVGELMSTSTLDALA